MLRARKDETREWAFKKSEEVEEQFQQRVGRQIRKLDIADGPLKVDNNEFMEILPSYF